MCLKCTQMTLLPPIRSWNQFGFQIQPLPEANGLFETFKKKSKSPTDAAGSPGLLSPSDLTQHTAKTVFCCYADVIVTEV